MSARTYGTTVIPSDQITVRSGGSVDLSFAFERSVALVGTMNHEEGSATAGESHVVRAASDAEELFGEDSELYLQARLALQQNIAVLYCIPVEETEQNQTISGGAGQLDEAPIIDPVVTPGYEFEAYDVTTDAAVDVEVTYDTPSFEDGEVEEGDNLVKVNPNTGEVASFDVEADIDLLHRVGDYESAIDMAIRQEPRRLGLLSESEELANYVAQELASRAQGFQFSHATYGANPDLDPLDAEHNMSDFRMSVVATSRGYVDDARTQEVRTAGLVAARLASKALGSSATYDNVGGLTGLRHEYTPTEAGQLIDEGYMPLIRLDGIKIIKDMTTSDDQRFERAYAVEVVDEATELSHIINQQFIGEANTEENREMLNEAHRTAYADMASTRPPLLDDFLVNTEQNEANKNQVDIEIGLDIVGVIDTIRVNILVGDVITNVGPDEDPVY